MKRPARRTTNGRDLVAALETSATRRTDAPIAVGYHITIDAATGEEAIDFFPSEETVRAFASGELDRKRYVLQPACVTLTFKVESGDGLPGRDPVGEHDYVEHARASRPHL